MCVLRESKNEYICIKERCQMKLFESILSQDERLNHLQRLWLPTYFISLSFPTQCYIQLILSDWALVLSKPAASA